MFLSFPRYWKIRRALASHVLLEISHTSVTSIPSFPSLPFHRTLTEPVTTTIIIIIIREGKNLNPRRFEKTKKNRLFPCRRGRGKTEKKDGKVGRKVETLRRTLRGSLLENSRHVRGGAIVAPRNTVGQVTRIISGEARNTGQLD